MVQLQALHFLRETLISEKKPNERFNNRKKRTNYYSKQSMKESCLLITKIRFVLQTGNLLKPQGLMKMNLWEKILASCSFPMMCTMEKILWVNCCNMRSRLKFI